MDTDQLGCLHLRKLTLIDQPVQLANDICFQVPLFRIGQAKVGEHVAAAERILKSIAFISVSVERFCIPQRLTIGLVGGRLW
jgi:hypothetical protein